MSTNKRKQRALVPVLSAPSTEDEPQPDLPVAKRSKKAEEEVQPEETKEEPIEEEKEESKALVTYHNGAVVIKDKDSLYEYWEQVTQCDDGGVIYEMIKVDLYREKFHCFQFYLMDDFVSRFEFRTVEFPSGKSGKTTEVQVFFPQLQGKKTPFMVRAPPGIIQWFTGPCLGNWHPWEDKEKGITNDLGESDLSVQVSYSCPRHLPELKEPVERWRLFIETIAKHGAIHAWNSPTAALHVKKAIQTNFKKLTPDQQMKKFLEAPYQRSIYKSVDKTDGDPYVITISCPSQRVCFPSEAEQMYNKDNPNYRPYDPPCSDPKVKSMLLDFHNNVKPKCKEGGLPLYYVYQHINIFDVDGRPVKRKDRKENQVFDKEGNFIEPFKRSSIKNGTSGIWFMGMKFTEFKGGIAANIGMKFVMKEEGVQIWREPEQTKYQASSLSYDSDDENAPTPCMPALKRPMIDDSIDDALLTHELPVITEPIVPEPVPMVQEKQEEID